MISKTTKDFQNEVLNNMTFKPYKTENYTIYKNENKPELGYFIKYSREGYYDFGIGGSMNSGRRLDVSPTDIFSSLITG